jgi:GAF domain-containing protein
MHLLRDTEHRHAKELSHHDGSEHTARLTARPAHDFLAETSRFLSDSFLRSTLTTAAGLALPLLGTWCMVDLVEDDGGIRRPIVLHPEAEPRDRALRFYRAHAPKANEPIGAARVLRSTEPDLVVVNTQDALSGVLLDTRDLLADLGACTFLVIAMRLSGKTVGAITYGSTTTRTYLPSDLLLAGQLGRRCASTVDNARVYGESQMARVRAEHAFAMEDAARAEFAYARVAAGRGAA